VLLAALSSCFGCAAPSDGEKPVSFTDPHDGAFDASEFLASRHGFVPVPIVITEPAVGFGGGLGVLFVHDKPLGADGQPVQGPPSITAVAGAYTETDTRFAGIAHLGVWDEDHWRYNGILGTGLANLKFDGSGGDPAGSGGERELPYQLEGVFVRQQLLRRVAKVPLFLGLSYEFSDARSTFESGTPAIGDLESRRTSGSLAAVLEYDSRDSIFTPGSGTDTTVKAFHYDEAFGGDAAYERLEIDAPTWIPLEPNLVLGLRPMLTVAGEGTPFYALPYVTLRGVPALRYQGREVASLETELRWNFVPRWALVGFGGLGQAVNSTSDFGGESETVCAGGVGFRYLIASKYGLHVGLDVARGPEDTAVYIQIGSAWH
jgi:hypothetical protein